MMKGKNVREKLEQYISRIKDVAPFKIHLEIDNTIDTLKFSMEVRKSIFLIFKEAVNNALKYAEATNMFVQLKQVERSVQFIITDDGKGFNTSGVTYGNGLGTMALRAKGCKGNFVIHAEEGKGTQIKVTIPIPHIRQKI